MNCPRCHQLVGEDQFVFGTAREIADERGTPCGVERDLYIDCPFCGAFHAVRNELDRCIISLRGPFVCGRDRRRILARLPRCRGRRLAET